MLSRPRASVTSGRAPRFGDPVLEHVEHVANAVAPDAQAVAWLHELFELAPLGRETLRSFGLTAIEEATLELLTHTPTQSFEEYISRIAHAPGRCGRLARMVKLADLDDHLGHAWIPPGAPPYSWARRYLLEQRGRRAARADDVVVRGRLIASATTISGLR